MVVASHRAWIAKHLKEAQISPVRLDAGLDAPIVPSPETTSWWTPTEHAVRLLHAGLTIPFQAPGPNFLNKLPNSALQRHIWTGPLQQLPQKDIPKGFCKVAEAKIEKLPAAWYEDTEDFLRQANNLNIPSTTQIQVTPTRLTFAWEIRMFLIGTHIMGQSAYLNPDGQTFPLTNVPDSLLNEAQAFTNETVNSLDATPDGWVLDVGYTITGEWVIIEANPAWSSNPYDTNPKAVFLTIAAATLPSATGTGYLWQPDPWLKQYAESRRKLQLSELPSPNKYS